MKMRKVFFRRVRKNASKGLARARGPKRRRRRTRRNLLRYVWILGLVGVLAFGGWGYVKIKPIVSAWTTLQQITVLGVDRVRREEVVALLNLPKKISLLSLETGPLIERLESHPWISAASVERVFPDTLAIRITEREAVAILDSPEGAHLLDNEGYVLSAIPAHPLPSLPVVRGLTLSGFQQQENRVREQARNAINVATALTGALTGVPTVKVTSQSTFVADLPETRFHIGSSFHEQWRRFRALYPSIQDRMQATPQEIDLRYPGKVILRERE